MSHLFQLVPVFSKQPLTTLPLSENPPANEDHRDNNTIQPTIPPGLHSQVEGFLQQRSCHHILKHAGDLQVGSRILIETI